jgi:hypothetical protein
MDLYKIREEILEIISQKQKEIGITFEEESHKYTMLDTEGNLRSEWPSVSKVLKKFYPEFPTDEAAEKKSKGDPVVKQQLIEEWAAAGDYSTNMGSRVHYILEQESHKIFKIDKVVRKPEFNCDITQILKGDSMVSAGKKFLKLMENRNVVLLDTEMTLGSQIFGFVGTPDKIWLVIN